MTIEDINFLSDSSKREHKVTLVRCGPGHGEPACDAVVREKTCASVKDEGWGRYSQGDESLCNCGAVEHNRKVDELVTRLMAFFN